MIGEGNTHVKVNADKSGKSGRSRTLADNFIAVVIRYVSGLVALFPLLVRQFTLDRFQTYTFLGDQVFLY